MSTRFKYGIAISGDLTRISEMDTIDEAASMLDSQQGDKLAVWQDGSWELFDF